MWFKRTLCTLLMLTLSAPGLFPAAVSAGMVETPTILQQQETDLRERLDAALARDDVRDQLEAYGVAPDDARQRVAALTDAELQLLSRRMEELPAGGNVLGLAVFVFLVLLVTDILGYTDIFPFVTSTVQER